MAPALCAQMQEATLAGDYATALKITDKLMPLHLATFQEPGLVSAKYGLSKLGLCSEEVRSPLVGLTDEAKATMDSALRHAGLIN
jgi:4-hydroxy-tetrahydrodipicolinate synthase